jgi:carbamoyl-phosphate synthase large subunit
LTEDYTETFVQSVGYPIVAKPRQGKGSTGVFLVHNEQELKKAVDLRGYVLQEYIGTEEDEYTVGCYCDKNGKLVDMIIMKRELQQGSTRTAKVINNDRIREEIAKICRQFRPIGPLNVQMRIDKEGRPVCFELNVRFSGTTPMRAKFGFRDVEAMIKEYVLDEEIRNCFCVRSGTAYRYINELYVMGEVDQIDDHAELISQLDGMQICMENLGK